MVNDNSTKPELLAEYQRLLAEAEARAVPVPKIAAGLNGRNKRDDLLAAVRALEKALAAPAGEKPAPKPEPKKEAPREAKKEPAPAPGPRPAARPKEDDELKLLNQKILDRLQALDAAKALRREELVRLEETEKALQRFVEMVNLSRQAYADQAARHEAEWQQRQAEETARLADCEAELERRLAAAGEKLNQARAEIEASREKRDSARAAEQEQYEYELSVREKREDDAWQDDLHRREAELARLQREAADLSEALAAREAEAAEWSACLDALPARLDEARKEGAAAREKKLSAEHRYEALLEQKEADAEAASLEKQIEALREDYAAALAEKDAVQAKLDRAYDESNKLYMQTVQSTGGVKIISGAEKGA